MANKLVAREQEILQFWQDNEIFKKSLGKSAPAGPLRRSVSEASNFVFYEGPPTANAAPGVHHVLARAFKDIFPRYKTMQGFSCVRKAGWDTHGLPVELQVEKKLGLKSKTEIENIVKGNPSQSIVKFNQECQDMVWAFKEDWEKLTARIGFWIDLSDPYITYQNGYIESVWQVVKKAADRDLLYQGHKVVPYCSRCGTALSSHEVAQGYREIEEDSVYIKCKVTVGNKFVQTGDYILTWTTTPWTLPGNVALAVNPDIEYIKVNSIWMAAALSNKVFPEQEYGPWLQPKLKNGEIIKGKDLVGIAYQPLFEGAVDPGDSKTAWTVQAADFVTTDEGTGVVHTAVMYGEDDYQLGEQVGLPKQHTVDQGGKFLEQLGPLAGKYVKDEKTTELIYKQLKDSGAFYKIVPYEHDYPFCWRCDTPLIYYAKDSWFIAMSKLQKDLLNNAKEINWVPSHIKAGRFGEWLNGIKDWAVSRERYWGTPLPVWRSEDKEQTVVIGSLAQLYEKAIKKNVFYIMRHTTAKHNVAGIVNGELANSDKYPLTPEGEKQAAKAAKKLAKAGITKIVCSPFLRTKQTAEIIAKELNVPVEINGAFIEVVVAGHEEQKFFDEYRNFGNNGFSEDPDAVITRMLKGVVQLNKNNDNQKILIISHGDPVWFTQAVVAGAEIKPAMEVPYPDHDESFDLLPVLPELITADGKYNLHRPYIDEVKLQGDGGKILSRTNEVMDVWLDSGSMPFAQYHYPFFHQELIDKKRQYPAEFISEAIDQTRGWFYTLLAVSTIMDKGTSYKNVICLGHINDAKGQKMSKSKGNIVNPWEIIDQYGADALRWYLYTINQPGEPKNFDPQGVAESSRKPLALLDNVLSFYLLYAKIKEIKEPQPTNILDRWILARLNQLTELVTNELDQYHVIESARAIGEFVNELSTWYVRRSRDRFKAGDQVAVQTLGYVLLNTAKLLAPFVPFTAESIYQDLKGGQSVHLDSWPKVNKKAIDKNLLEQMELARNIVERGLAARAEAKIKVRQPLQSYSTDLAKDLPAEIVELITNELNIKELKFGAVKLETEINSALQAEGLAREVIRQINQLRKETKLTINDKVIVYQDGLDDLFDQFIQEIKIATLASEVKAGKTKAMKPVGLGQVGIEKA